MIIIINYKLYSTLVSKPSTILYWQKLIASQSVSWTVTVARCDLYNKYARIRNKYWTARRNLVIQRSKVFVAHSYAKESKLESRIEPRKKWHTRPFKKAFSFPYTIKWCYEYTGHFLIWSNPFFKYIDNSDIKSIINSKYIFSWQWIRHSWI